MRRLRWQCHLRMVSQDYARGDHDERDAEVLTSLPLMRQKWVGRITQQCQPPLVPSWNPVHVQQRPHLERADINHLQQSPNSGLKAAVHIQQDLLADATVPAYTASARYPDGQTL
jgi:hypothetical protein